MWRHKNSMGALPVLSMVALSACIQYRSGGEAKHVAANVQISSFHAALGHFKLDTRSFPTTRQGLEALCRDPGTKGWNGPYLSREVPNDPWNRPYVYRYPGEHSDEPDIVSLGADGKPGGAGRGADIVSWKVN